MNTQAIHCKKSDDGNIIEYHVLGLDDSDFFDSLIKFFKKNYSASVESRIDGLITRVWQLQIKGEYFTLEHHSDLGNWFYSCSSSGDSPLMQEIALDLEARLKNIPYE